MKSMQREEEGRKRRNKEKEKEKGTPNQAGNEQPACLLG